MKNVCKQICFIALVAVMGLAFTAPVFSGGIVDRAFNGGAKSGGSSAPPDETANAPPATTPATTAPATTPTTTQSATPTEGPASGGPGTWTYIGRPLGTSAIRTIAFGNSRWVAVGSDGKMAYCDW